MFDIFFEYLSDLFSFPVDRVRYVTLFLVSFPLASLLRIVLHYSYTSPTIRHTVSALLGLLFGWMCFQWQVFYLIGFVSVGYILLITLPPTIVQRYSMIYALIGISTGHIYRLITDYGGYTLDFTGPLMLLVQRVSYVAYAYHDGVARDEKDLSDDQKKLKISSIPSLLEYFSYNFSFMTFLAGPTVAYKNYDDFITGANFTQATNNKSTTEPSPLIPTLKTFLLSMTALSIVAIGSSWTDTSLLLDPSLQLPRRLFNTLLFCIVTRSPYYFSFLITETACNAGGLGFTGYDKEGREVWDLAKSINFKGYEFGANPREMIMSWNMKTALWIRRVFYERGASVIQANVVSALWHGFYPGYYLSFTMVAFGSITGRKLRYLLWHRFQSPRYVKILYDISSTVSTVLFREFIQVTFLLLTIENILTYWRHLYFAPFFILLFTALVLPDKKRQKKSE
ncbi:PREDICTED: membrane-bound O-acyltransferase domain-containing protein 2-like [Amphimedon queenslandica]|uniref:Uncharacterized protein n=1 Tax=Amphimedon queenslandica TaxID=400682 RepID=A0AAN0IGL8_AMPQE|nr:PREDICTED: membrane-bound O-acyltransferase domain-containing protein 2-like [Amphimedon queenslandica]|eukprot:XP_003388609.1 PREDICTED: membrane-bound O-acyltransferase domain-containing protein 2-like [Amphimedon queenslandica]